MFVRRAYRGRGYVARRCWRSWRTRHVPSGYTRVLMETGGAQPEAMAPLRDAAGTSAIPGFGHYRNEPLNRCYAKTL